MTDVRALLKPFAWLAAAGFVAGFGGYLAMGHGRAQAAEQAQAQLTSGPSGDEWNLPKHI